MRCHCKLTLALNVYPAMLYQTENVKSTSKRTEQFYHEKNKTSKQLYLRSYGKNCNSPFYLFYLTRRLTILFEVKSP